MKNTDYEYLLQGDNRNEWLVANEIQTEHINKFYEKIGMAHQSKINGYQNGDTFEIKYKTDNNRNITYTYIISMEFHLTYRKLYYINTSTKKKREIIERLKLQSHNGAKANYKGDIKIK